MHGLSSRLLDVKWYTTSGIISCSSPSNSAQISSISPKSSSPPLASAMFFLVDDSKFLLMKSWDSEYNVSYVSKVFPNAATILEALSAVIDPI